MWKSNEKGKKYLDLARETKKAEGIFRVTVIPIVIGALETVSQCHWKRLEIKGRIEAIHSKKLLRSTTLPKRVLEIRETLVVIQISVKKVSIKAGKKKE